VSAFWKQTTLFSVCDSSEIDALKFLCLKVVINCNASSFEVYLDGLKSNGTRAEVEIPNAQAKDKIKSDLSGVETVPWIWRQRRSTSPASF